MTSSIRIYDLLDFPQHVPASSRWMWEEWDNCAAGRWGKASKKPKVSAGAMLFHGGVVAIENDAPVGAMSLLAQDHDDHPEHTPWMACQDVVPGARGSNVAMALSNALKD